MKSTLFIAAALVVTPCWAGAESLHAQIAGSDKIVSKFLLAKDIKGFKAYMKGIVTADFKHVENGKALGFDAMCKEMEQGLGMMKKMNQASESVMRLQEHGNSATATTNHYLQGVMPGKGPKPTFLSFVGTTNDTWVKQHGKWKLSRMEWTQQSMMINGKPVGGPKPAPRSKAA